ncbi:MAG: CDP-archaeol synthase [Patescibacteria group bacterium]
MSLNVFGFLSVHSSFIQKHDAPFDASKLFFDGRRILGDSTTWGGLLVVVILGVLAEFIFPHAHFFILSLLVFLGHAVGSFIKRRLSFARGQFLPFVDHGDYVLAAGIYLLATHALSIFGLFFAYVLTLLITPLVTFIAHAFKLRQSQL